MPRSRPLTLLLAVLVGAALAWACTGPWYEDSVLEVGDAAFKRPLESVWSEDVKALIGPAPKPLPIAERTLVLGGVVRLLDQELARRQHPRREELVRSAAMHLSAISLREPGMIYRAKTGEWVFRVADLQEDPNARPPQGAPLDAQEVLHPHRLVAEDTLPKLLRELPEEFRFYIRSLASDRHDAADLCDALLHLPAEQRRNLSALATYRRARLRILMDADEDEDGSAARLQDVRKDLLEVKRLVSKGQPDVAHLALAAEGWLAYTYLYGNLSEPEYDPENPAADPAKALRMYVALHRAGDATARNSIENGLRTVLLSGNLKPLASDPLIRRLTTAYLCSSRWLRFDGPIADESALTLNGLIRDWIDALRAAKADVADDAVRLAALQYRVGQWDACAETLKLAPATDATAQLLVARLRLRDGDLAGAEQVLRPLAARPIVVPKPDPSGENEPHGPPFYSFNPIDFGGGEDPLAFLHDSDYTSKAYLWSACDTYILDFGRDLGAISRARAELAIVALHHGHYVEAMNLFYGEDLLRDGNYIAECILSTDELKAAVDASWSVKPATAKGGSVHDHGMTSPEHVRAVLGRRLFRDGRWEEAVPYLAEEHRKSLREFIGFMRVAQDPKQSRRARADAYWRAALNVSSYGEEYLFCTYGLDWTSLADRHWYDPRSVPRMRLEPILDEPESLWAPPSADEIRRVGAWSDRNLDHPIRAYRDAAYEAYRLALEAAKLLPDNDLAGEQILQWAGNLLKYREPKAAVSAYRQLATRFSKTGLGAYAEDRHWFAKTPIQPDPDCVLKHSQLK